MKILNSEKTAVCGTVLSVFFLLPVMGQEGLVGYWSFDRVQGDVFPDHTDNKNHATGIGAVQHPGIRGNAVYFDGEDDYVVIGDDENTPPGVLRNLGEGSISLWFKVEHIPVEHGIAPILYYGNEEKCDFFDAANEGLIIEVGHSPVHYRSERLYFTMWKNGCTYPSFCYDSNHATNKGQWYHLVVVVGPDYNTGYLNGEEMTDRRYNFGNAGYSQFFEDAVKHERMWLGQGHWDRTVQHFRGLIDELRIYDRPLSAGEVKTLYSDTTDVISGTVPGASGIPPGASGGSSVVIYPNPAAEVIHFNVEDPDFEPTDVEIRDLSGNMVIHHADRNSHRGSMNTEALNPGVYFLRINGRNTTLEQRFIIR